MHVVKIEENITCINVCIQTVYKYMLHVDNVYSKLCSAWSSSIIFCYSTPNTTGPTEMGHLSISVQIRAHTSSRLVDNYSKHSAAGKTIAMAISQFHHTKSAHNSTLKPGKSFYEQDTIISINRYYSQMPETRDKIT